MHAVALYFDTRIVDVVTYALILAPFGLLAGAVMAFGISAVGSLLSRRPRLGRALGGALLGGLGFAAVFAPLMTGEMMELPVGLVILGNGLFGTIIGLGITAPAVIGPRRAVALVGGAVGGTVGILFCRTLGFPAFQVESVPTPVLLLSGAVVGLILALSITWAEARWATGKKRRR
jgi:hypothetical protein